MIKINIDPAVFNEAYLPYLNATSRVQIFYGGAGSGKSVFISQRCVYDVLKGGRNYVICRAVGRTLRGSVFTQVLRTIREWNVSHLFTVNKSDMTITCTNGYQIVFTGLDDVEKLKSLTVNRGAITDVWVEEATEVTLDAFKQLFKRQRGKTGGPLKRIVMTFNPVIKTHWIYTLFFTAAGWKDDQQVHDSPSLLILKTWYIHNRFLTPEDIEDLLSETDEYYRTVYTFGGWGVLGNVIFTNWSVEDLSGMRDQFTNRRHGLDFGFSSDPAAVVCTHYDRARKIIYIFDELYERGLTNDVLAKDLKKLIGSDYVVCDSAEPKSIFELRQYGINAQAARKGKDSVLFGIQWLQQQTIIVDSACVNVQNELLVYKWKEDSAGHAMRVPVDRDNHAIDGLRYAYEDESGGTLNVY